MQHLQDNNIQRYRQACQQGYCPAPAELRYAMMHGYIHFVDWLCPMFRPQMDPFSINITIANGHRGCLLRLAQENKLHVNSGDYMLMVGKGWWDVLVLLSVPKTRGVVNRVFEEALRDRCIYFIRELLDKVDVTQSHLETCVKNGDEELLTVLHPYVVRPLYPPLVTLAVESKHVDMVHTLFHIIQRGSKPQAVFQWLLKNPQVSLIMKEAEKSMEVRRLLKAGRSQFPHSIRGLLKDLNVDGLL
ncbi:MAG: hypothetical protein K0U52_11340 [Gammaproteobacteria bacterium]|nr:hypothetical protein [Gammaproteobacteria bacterium]